MQTKVTLKLPIGAIVVIVVDGGNIKEAVEKFLPKGTEILKSELIDAGPSKTRNPKSFN